jgi:hypothetical protein
MQALLPVAIEGSLFGLCQGLDCYFCNDTSMYGWRCDNDDVSIHRSFAADFRSTDTFNKAAVHINVVIFDERHPAWLHTYAV